MVVVVNKDVYWSLSQLQIIRMIWCAKCIIIIKARQQGKTELGTKLLSAHVMDDISKPITQYIAAMNTMEQCNKYIVNRFMAQLGQLQDTGIFTVKSIAGNAGKEMILRRPWIGPESMSITHLTGMGNRNAIRGGSYDFGYFDEVEQYPANTVANIILPMFTETRGRILLTGTVESFSEFYKTAMSYDAFQREGDRTFCFIDHDVFTANNFSDRLISRIHRIYHSNDNMQGFWAEFMNNPFMAASKKNPMTTHMRNIQRVFDKGDVHYNQININLDRGISKGHMPYVAWQVDQKNKPLIMDYSREDFTDLYMIPDLLVKRYRRFHRINIIFPSDIYTTVYKQGYTEYSFFMSMLKKKGLTEKVCVTTLPKIEPNGKKVIIKRLIERFFYEFRFLVSEAGVGELLKDISQVAFTKNDKTGHYDYSKPVQNDYIHVLDAVIYAFLSLNERSSEMAMPAGETFLRKKIKYFDGRLYGIL